MRVALLTSSGMVNGVAVHCLTLIKFLLGRGHSVLLVHRPGAWLAEQSGIENATRASTSFGRRPSEVQRVGHIIKAFGADVLHTHMSSAHTYGALGRLFGTVPVVATAHVAHFQLHWPLNHVVIATSQHTADYNRRFNRVPQKALRVIPNFIELDGLPLPNANERAAARAMLNLPNDAFVVGSVGHLARYKRPSDLVRAFGLLAAVHPNARLLLIGNPLDAAQDVRRVVMERGLADRVSIIGHRADATHLLAAIDVFALASGRESGPIAILEAMARGRPVVATRVGMLPEMVLEGRTGHLVDVGDFAGLGRHLIELSADEARRSALGAAGRAHVERHFTAEILCPQIEAVLQEATTIRPKPIFGWIWQRLLRQKAGERHSNLAD